jgi:hypothetical protein
MMIIMIIIVVVVILITSKYLTRYQRGNYQVVLEKYHRR